MHTRTKGATRRAVAVLIAVVPSGTAGLLAAGGGAAPADDPRGTRRVTITVSETEGVRRFGYPVSATVPLPRPAGRDDKFRLSQAGKLVPAQFEPGPPADKGASVVRVAFETSPAPHEERTYTLEYGPALENGPGPGRGLRVGRGDGVVRVSSGDGLSITVPDDLLGLLRQVRVGDLDFLRPGSPGLRIRTNGALRPGGPKPGGKPPAATVTRRGPVIAALRFEGVQNLGAGRSLTSVTELEFARSKSWVRVGWDVDDPSGDVLGLDAELHLNVSGAPTLVDFGAGSLVYAALGKGQEAILRGRSADGAADAPAWETLVGPAGSLRPYVVAPRRKGAPPAEGWAHVMDRERCTAVAVDGFADPGQECELSVTADGRLRVRRTFASPQGAPPRGIKRLSFTLHFVGMPVHVGAATSPQAMLHPLRVDVGRPAGGAP